VDAFSKKLLYIFGNFCISAKMKKNGIQEVGE